MGEVDAYLDGLLRAVEQSEWVFQKDLSFRQIDTAEVYIKGDLSLYGGFVLHILISKITKNAS